MLISLTRLMSRAVGAWWFGAAPDWVEVRRRAALSTTASSAPREVKVTQDSLAGLPVEILTPLRLPPMRRCSTCTAADSSWAVRR